MNRTTIPIRCDMNKLESKYAEQLEFQTRANRILGYDFECHKFRLAKKTWYTPDFLVWISRGEIEFHEVKGFWRDDARVKIKAVADRYPMYCFRAVQWEKKRWVFEDFNT